MKKPVIISLVLSICFPCFIFAETVKLKNGRVFEGGVITEKTKDYIILQYRGVPLKYHLDEIASISDPDNIDPDGLVNKTAEAIFTPDSSAALQITINAPIKLDYKSKNEIYEMRKKYISQYSELASKDYSPSDVIFGQIEDGKPWWGLLGLSYYGSGNQGASEESRFITNPFLLVGLNEVYAYKVKNSNLPPIEIYPKPISLSRDKTNASARVRYNVTDCWRKKQAYNISSEYSQGFELIAYNARDFGYNYLYIEPNKSKNIIPCAATGSPVLIGQYIHCGGSCGLPGGCNNMSPNQPELRINLSDVPAQAYIKLWKEQPLDIKHDPDMVFIIEMI